MLLAHGHNGALHAWLLSSSNPEADPEARSDPEAGRNGAEAGPSAPEAGFGASVTPGEEAGAGGGEASGLKGWVPLAAGGGHFGEVRSCPQKNGPASGLH